MSSTQTQNKFIRPPPSAVTYDLLDAHVTTITLPPGSTWTSGLHWHDSHTEFLQVVAGSAEVHLSGKVLPSVKPEDGIITVPRGALHQWHRSKTHNLEKDLVVKEWTEPRDGQKRKFFQSLNLRILEAIDAGQGSWQMRVLELNLMNIFWRLDNFPALLSPSRPSWLQGLATRTVLAGAVALGWLLGCPGVYQ